MRTKLLLFILVLVAIIAQAQVSYPVSFNPNGLLFNRIQAADGNWYTTVSLDGCDGSTNEVGRPMLPTKTIKLMIPYGKVVQSVTCSEIVLTQYNVRTMIYPAEDHDSLCSVFSAPDTIVYRSTNGYPSNRVFNNQQGYFDGNNNIVTIEICPFEYLPMSGLLKLATSMTITVNYADGFPGGIPNIKRLQRTQDQYDALLFDMVDNTESIASYKTAPTIVQHLDTTSRGLPAYEYVIIAPEIYRDTLQDFIEWKRQKGNWAGFVPLEQILTKYPEGDTIGTYPIQDTPGCMRQFLRDSYMHGTSHVFIVGVNSSREQLRFGCLFNIDLGTIGNIDTIPFPSGPLVSTDYYFNDMTGDWNHDGDTLYGEPYDDAPSNNFSLHVGRLICSTPAEFGNWKRKLLVYEKNPGCGDASYLTKTIITADTTLLSEAHGILLKLPPTLVDTMVVSHHQGNTLHPTGSEVVSVLNAKSYGLMFWCNHGGTNADHSGILVSGRDGSLQQWKLVAEDIHDHANSVEVGNGLDNITYRNTPFIICSESCKVMPYEANKAMSPIQRRNCGESFTVGNYGGVAFLGCSDINITFGNTLCISFAKELCNPQLNNNDAQLSLICEKIKQQSFLWKYIFNLMGDPECRIWTKTPIPLQMQVQSTGLMEYIKGEVCVTVSNLRVNEKARVTLYSEGDIFQTMEITGANPIALFDSVFPVTHSSITVTTTSINHLPVQIQLPVTSQCSVEITSDTLWADDFIASWDYIIPSGVTLTVRCEVGMNANSKIQVLPGGKLIVDGGRLYCSIIGHQWQGIRVLGVGGYGFQRSSNITFDQGYVHLMNDATIQDARVAIDLWDGIHLNTTGGIAHVEDASFINNGMAFRALYFQNQYPNGTINDYNAFCHNCEFIVNASYPSYGEVFRHHVELTKVKGIKFLGCSFQLHNCPSGLLASDNAAIYSSNAGFWVNRLSLNGNTNPNQNYVNSLFDGFDMGINAISTETMGPVTVMYSDFQNNTMGFRSFGDTNPTLLFNSFEIGGSEQCSVGAYMDQTSTFCIEENTFVKASNTPSTTDCIGIVVKESKNGNLIYRNTFANLTCGNLAIGQNWSGSAIDNGLEYQCNQNSGNDVDFYVQSPINLSHCGIQTYQGTLSNAAGNTFSQSGVTYQFYNSAADLLSYYYDPNLVNGEPDLNYTHYIKKLASQNSNDCSSNYGNPVLRTQDRLQRKSDYDEAHNNYLNTKLLYDSYIDGGNTAAELSNIANATSQNAWNLRTRLLSHSPYLSQETMRAVANKDDVFSVLDIFEILASNPEELGRDSLLAYLEEKEHPLPEYLLNILRETANGNTYRSALESQLVCYRQEFSAAAADIVRSILNDSVTDPFELREWLGKQENINADRQIISSYINEGNDSAAFALANLLPELYQLSDEALREHEGYLRLLDMQRDLANQGRTVQQLTGPETRLVDSLAAYGVGVAQTIATGYLEMIRGITTTECPDIDILDDRGNKATSQAVSLDQIAEAMGLRVSINPNPTTDQALVEYVLPDGNDRAVMTIFGPKGDLVKAIELFGKQGAVSLDLTGFAKGIYIYCLESSKVKTSGKIILE